MPAPYRYDIQPVDVGNYFDAFRQGRADRLATEAEGRERKLSEYLPGALKGDAGMRDQALASATSDQMIALNQAFAGADQAKLAQAREKNSRMASLLNAVQTGQIPLDRAKNIAVSELGIDPQKVVGITEADIPGFIAQTQTLSEQFDRFDKERTYKLDASRTKAQNAASYASAAKDRAAIAPQIGPDGKPLPPPVDNKQVDNEAKIRGEFTNQSKDFVTIRDSYQRVLGAAERSKERPDSAAGDLALIFSYMKILDPGSVVRETEFANAENAAGVDERTRALFNKVRTGEKLAADQRADFVDRARTLYKRALESHGGNKKVYRDLAKRYNFDPERVAPDLSLGISGDAPRAPTQTPIVRTAAEHAALPSGAEYVDSADGKRYRKK